MRFLESLENVGSTWINLFFLRFFSMKKMLKKIEIVFSRFFPENVSLKKSMKIEIFEISKIFARVFPIFGAMSPPLGELISKVEWFFWSRFFCASMSVSELYGKNCLGDVVTVHNPEKDLNFFSWQIFPEASIHLPGEREMVVTYARKYIHSNHQIDFRWPSSQE